MTPITSLVTPMTSLVMGACNAARFLYESLESVQVQTVDDWELVLVDDGSTDLTAAIGLAFARRDRRFRVLPQAHAGIAAARNAGFAATDVRSGHIAFLDADDLWETNALEALLGALAGRPEAVGVCGAAYHLDARGVPFGGVKTPVGPAIDRPLPFERLSEAFALPPGAFLVRRWACEAAGPFDAATLGCDDWDFWLRLALNGPVLPIGDLVVGYRRHDANLTNHERLVDEGRDRLRQKIASYQRARAARHPEDAAGKGRQKTKASTVPRMDGPTAPGSGEGDSGGE